MLPYATVGEAAAALGRNLTAAEMAWFRYSAGMHDFWLYLHNLVFLLVVYTVAPLPLALVELLVPDAIHKYKVQPKVQVPVADVVKCYKNVVKIFIFAVGPLEFLSFHTSKWVGVRTGLPLPSAWEMAAQLTVYFMVEDYFGYWLHRALHSRWGYEHIHSVHHEFSAPFGFAAPYAHWAEVLILGLPAFLGPAIAPGHIVTFWLWFVLRHIEAVELHCGYDFPLTPTKLIPFYGGAEFHDYHHYVGRHTNNNFASVFTYCDYIYGTDKGYRYQKRQSSNSKGISTYSTCTLILAINS
ncbi:methylsterol monooxygenase 1-1 isoform X1 [Canna indica]|uniref:aldehyde oxygenase (deformylating) n=1 Tax=Canna indica TaxID=4628 RepID=A0AAQ3QHJ7_9LILI|nr:methylsterol monooxygenase 1-1 isoform X1 [Canna indica]